MDTVTISPKGQVVIPTSIRARLKIKAGQRVQGMSARTAHEGGRFLQAAGVSRGWPECRLLRESHPTVVGTTREDETLCCFKEAT